MSDSAPTEVLRLSGITRNFEQGNRLLHVLKGVDLILNSGELVALIGPSGSGKSTLLHIAGLLERPSDGEVYLDGQASRDLLESERTTLRRRTLGFVYQNHHLLGEFSALENVVIPQMIAGIARKQAAERAHVLLERLGLSDREGHLPAQLSGGEQQRVALARALANQPKLLLADEPTGNLDPDTADRVFDELIRQVRQSGVAAIIATHNPILARRMDRRLSLVDGHIEELNEV